MFSWDTMKKEGLALLVVFLVSGLLALFLLCAILLGFSSDAGQQRSLCCGNGTHLKTSKFQMPPVDQPSIWKDAPINQATERAAPPCGSYTLGIGESLALTVSTTPWDKPPSPVCKWSYQGTSLQSRITFSCDSFTLQKCLGITLEIVGGTLRKSYCGVITGLYEVSTSNQMDITLSSYGRGLGPNDGFTCTVRAVNAASTGGTGTNCVTEITGPKIVDSTCKCGRQNLVPRIVGGNKANVNGHPWQVAISKSTLYRPYCGGSIICNKWVLTAAHCVVGQTPSQNLVVIGEHQWTSTTDTPVTEAKEIQQIIIHPDYDAQLMDNDIALIELKTAIVFPPNNMIAPVCMPSGSNLYENVEAIATGWGTLSYGGSQPSTLYEVNIPTMTNAKCSTYINGITANMICAGVEQGGKDTCTGDSGGPLTTASSTGVNTMVQLGVASWGYGCGEARKPGVYARVTRYLTWIYNYTAECRYCAGSP